MLRDLKLKIKTYLMCLMRDGHPENHVVLMRLKREIEDLMIALEMKAASVIVNGYVFALTEFGLFITQPQELP
jgi:hypothetical protein